MKKLIVAAIAAVTLVGCVESADSLPQRQANGDAIATDDLLDVMHATWDETPAADKENICWLYNLDSDLAWSSFNDGAGEQIVSYSTFKTFFDGVC